MSSDNFRRVSAPGLPTWPPLLFDSHRRRAMISARHPVWRGQEWALTITELLSVFVTGVLALLAWPYFIPHVDIVGRILLGTLAVVFAAWVLKFLLHQSVGLLLARWVLSTKIDFWFTPEAVAFRSRLYARPVVVWRHWQHQPVGVRFIIQEDRDAISYVQSLDGKRKLPTHHLREAKLLELVMTTARQQGPMPSGGQDNILRTIPVTEVNCRWAAKLTMVCAAAVMLTADQDNSSHGWAGGGADIDAL